MSIYCSFGILDGVDGDAPIVYQGSHVLPARTDERGGSVDLGYVPGFVRRPGREDDRGDEEDGTVDTWPYLRVILHGGADAQNCVVLDVDQVDRLVADLTWWRSRVREER